MSSSDSPISIPFKSKKPLHSNPKTQKADPLSFETPKKEPPLRPRRTRNSNVALSIKEVRESAQSKPKRNRTDQIESVRRQILSWPNEESPVKSSGGSKAKDMPEKYMELAEFFDNLGSAIRLLKLRGSNSTFTNICPTIQSLTDRRFSYGHLAQLKFILPEAIEIKKLLVHDERSCCMKPDLVVTINVDAIEIDGKSKSKSKNINLSRVFRARLMSFLKDHPEGDEIPEETLPEPFNRSKPNVHSDMMRTPTSFSTGSSTGAEEPLTLSASCQIVKAPSMSSAHALKNQQPVVASHLSRSFRRHFSQKLVNNEAEKAEADKKSSNVSLEHSDVPVQESCLNKISSSEEVSFNAVVSPIKLSSKSIIGGKCLADCASKSTSCPPATPIKEIDPMTNQDSTSAKIASTPARLMSATPASHPPKRCYMTPEDVSDSSPNKLIRRQPRSRTLKFDSPMKNVKVEDGVTEMEGMSADDDILGILPENLLQSIREKEKKAIEERDPAISQAKKRRQMITVLPKLFNMIHYFFQSINRSVVTKQELTYKIISSNCDISDKRELEEQIDLLLELVPDWISEKLGCGGDLLVRINKMSSPDTVRAQLEEAI